jgi:hypothetical protein
LRRRRARRPHFFNIQAKEWDRNNFPIGINIEYSTTGQAGGYLTDSAPESTYQSVQPLVEVIAISFLSDGCGALAKKYGRTPILQYLHPGVNRFIIVNV